MGQAASQGLVGNYDSYLNKMENNIKTNLTYNNDRQDYRTNDFKPTDYFSQPLNNAFKPYEGPSSYSNNRASDYTTSNTSYNSSYRSEFKPVEPSPMSTYNSYNPNNLQTHTNSFKPASPTPLPSFDYTASSNPKPSSSYQPSTSYQPSSSYQPSPSFQPYTPSASAFSNDYPSSFNYKTTFDLTTFGDYYKDFTPPDILSKLRAENRDNITKIKDAMKGLSR